MNKAIKWTAVTVMWVVVALLAIFVNPKVSSFLAEQVTNGLMYIVGWILPFSVEIVAGVFNVILKYVFYLLLLAGEIGLALLGMGLAGMRKSAVKEPVNS